MVEKSTPSSVVEETSADGAKDPPKPSAAAEPEPVATGVAAEAVAQPVVRPRRKSSSAAVSTFVDMGFDRALARILSAACVCPSDLSPATPRDLLSAAGATAACFGPSTSVVIERALSAVLAGESPLAAHTPQPAGQTQALTRPVPALTAGHGSEPREGGAPVTAEAVEEMEQARQLQLLLDVALPLDPSVAWRMLDFKESEWPLVPESRRQSVLKGFLSSFSIGYLRSCRRSLSRLLDWLESVGMRVPGQKLSCSGGVLC